MNSIKSEFSPFDISLKGIGAFPNNKKARILWVGIDQGKENLLQLFSFIEDKILDLGFKKEKRGFHPHVTFARVKKGKYSLPEGLNFSFDEFPVQEVSLFKSVLTPKGPIYEIISEVPIRG